MKQLTRWLPLLPLLIAGIFVFCQALQPAAITEPRVQCTVPAQNLYIEYEYDTKFADARYRGQWLEVEGKVADKLQVSEKQTLLVFEESHFLFGIVCVFDAAKTPALDAVRAGDFVVLRGRCA